MINKVALVSGSNQGLGFALVEALCNSLGPNSSVYLTARNRARGEEAVRQLHDRDLSPIFHLLDVTDDASVAALAETIRTRHGGVDIIIPTQQPGFHPASHKPNRSGYSSTRTTTVPSG